MAGKNLFWYMDGLGSLSEIMFRIYIDGDYLCLDNVKPHMIGGGQGASTVQNQDRGYS